MTFVVVLVRGCAVGHECVRNMGSLYQKSGPQGTSKLWMIVWEYDKGNLDAGNDPALYELQNINWPEIDKNDETNEI